MSNKKDISQEDFDGLARRIETIEDYLFNGGGPGTPSAKSIERRMDELREAIEVLRGRSATKEDIEEIWEKLGMLDKTIESMQPPKDGGFISTV